VERKLRSDKGGNIVRQEGVGRSRGSQPMSPKGDDPGWETVVPREERGE